MSDDEPITVREAARRLGVHENTIRNWQKRGIIGRTITLPTGARRFSARDIERMRNEMWSQFAPATEMPRRVQVRFCPSGSPTIDTWRSFDQIPLRGQQLTYEDAKYVVVEIDLGDENADPMVIAHSIDRPRAQEALRS